MNNLAIGKTHVIITFNKTHIKINKKQYEAIVQMNGAGQLLLDGAMIKASNIAEILPIADYLEQYPEKKSQSYNEPRAGIESYEDIANKYKWTGYPKMMELVMKSVKAMDAWEGDWRDFYIKHKALDEQGSVTTMRVKDPKGFTKHIAFAYPFFQDIRRLVEERKAKKNYAEEKSWEDISKQAALIP